MVSVPDLTSFRLPFAHEPVKACDAGLPCATLVVYGDEFRAERGTPVAHLYGSEERDFPGLDHWDLVRDRRVREAIADFLGASSSDQRARRGPGAGGTSVARPP